MSEIHETLEDVDLAPTCLVKSLGRVRLFATPWTVAHQAPPSMEFSRQEYWSGLPFPSSGDLPDPGIELRVSTHCRQTLYRLSHQGILWLSWLLLLLDLQLISSCKYVILSIFGSTWEIQTQFVFILRVSRG